MNGEVFKLTSVIQTDVLLWSERFELGLAEIDLQHRQLVQLLNQLANHLAYQASIPTLNTVFNQLTEYALYHFQAEEQLWHQFLLKDALAEQHQDIHNRFIEVVLKLKAKQTLQSVDQVIKDILKFLTYWLTHHILESDRQLARVVLAMQSGLCLKQAKLQSDEYMREGRHFFSAPNALFLL
jgi:hemerythrin-like metal-binding protein